MKQRNITTALVVLIAIFSSIAACPGIFSGKGPGSYNYESIRGRSVEIYGKGIYQHMSADVAVQGRAQDYITLFAGVPLLLISLIGFRKGNLRSKFILTGIIAYFFVTYLFYTAMSMYNYLFLLYLVLLSLSFFALLVLLLSFNLNTLASSFSKKAPCRLTGGFLILNSVIIALLWLSIIVPPLIDGSLFPSALEHYTTLIVQGFDLSLLLPLAFVSGLLLIKKKPLGYLAGTTYTVFLSVLMTALTAKIIAMALNDVNVVPAIFIIPVINLTAIFLAVHIIRSIKLHDAE
jgi:hypothetical protein